MASFFDKVKSTNANQNSIGNVVSFSGADITVVAYRGPTPASKFRVDSLKEEIKIAEIDREDASNNLANTEIRLASAQSDLSATKKEIADRTRVLRNSGAPTGSSGLSSLNNQEGKYQQRVTSLTREVTTGKARLEGSTRHLEEKIDQQKKLSIADGYFELGSIHTISYSSFREKFAVRSLGVTQAKAYTRGQRTIAGTLVFNVLQQHDLMRLMNITDETGKLKHPDAVMLDQIDTFNLLLLFANEYGAYSALHLLDIDLQSEGQEMSIDNIVTHNTMNFYATDMIPMTNLGNRFSTYDEMIIGTINDITELGFSSGSAPYRRPIDSFGNPFADPEKNEEAKLIARSRGLF